MKGPISDPFSGEHSPQSLRSFVAGLISRGTLFQVDRPVSIEFEISGFLSLLTDGPAVYFPKVDGYDMPIIGNVLSTYDNIAMGLDVETKSIQQKLVHAIDNRTEPTMVSESPVQDVVVEEPDLGELPIPLFFEHETGPYITAGTIVARDPETNKRNYSIARIKPLGRNRAFVGIAPNHHLAILAQKAASRGEKLDVAVVIGNHPALLVASAFYLALGDDELTVAGTLLGQPIELVNCVSVPLEVPAHSELVLEGSIDPSEIVNEGRVSEFHGLYEDYKSGPVITFHALTRREDAVFQVIQPGYSTEHIAIGAVAIGATVADVVRQAVSSLDGVEITRGGCGRLHAILSLKSSRPGDARKAMFAAWASTNLIKNVVVVNADVDITDPVHVEWAIATRMKPDRDLVVVPKVRADRADPLEHEGTITKLGIDATITESDRPEWTLAQAPPETLRNIRKELSAFKTNTRLNF